jgi:hypothetical protein
MEAHAAEQADQIDAEEVEFENDTESDSDGDINSEEEELLDL